MVTLGLSCDNPCDPWTFRILTNLFTCPLVHLGGHPTVLLAVAVLSEGWDACPCVRRAVPCHGEGTAQPPLHSPLTTPPSKALSSKLRLLQHLPEHRPLVTGPLGG